MTDSVSRRSMQGPGRLKRFAVSLFLTLFVRWPQRRRQRLALLTLSDQHLKDIGVTPAEARREAGRPFWD